MSRRVLVLAHTGREESLKAAWEACIQLHASGIVPVMQKSELEDMEGLFGRLEDPVEILHDHIQLPDVELVMVLGGDGTILRAAELVREVDVPLLGVNLGHVGFLAESERADLAQTVEWIASRDYTVEERMTIDVQVWVRGQKIWHTWALNEAAIEKGNRERMLEVVTEVDERPLTSFGCDGVVMATPNRVDRLRLLRRRPGGVAGSGSPGDCSHQRPRAVRQTPGGLATLQAGRGGTEPHRCPGRAVV